MIFWVGDSDFMCPPSRVASACRWAMPLVEETVLETAFDASAHLRRVSRSAALNCVSRSRMRRALQPTGLNPSWQPLDWPDLACVVKAPCSSYSRGVQVVTAPPAQLAVLARYAPVECRSGVVEQYIEGPQYEVDGFVLGGDITTFRPVRQVWHGSVISRYEPAGAEVVDALHRATAAAVRAVGLDDCPFSVELRAAGPRWQVIEIHARLGEDPGLAAAMDCDPVAEIEQAAAKTDF